MTRLVLKIFLAYWIAAGTVIVLVSLEPRQGIHHLELEEALNDSLTVSGRFLIAAWEAGQCDEQQQQLLSPEGSELALATSTGKILCGGKDIPDERSLIQQALNSKKRLTRNYLRYEVIAKPLQSNHGTTYVVLLQSRYSNLSQMYGILPGKATIITSIAVTLLFAFMVALPIHRLRTAARQIASGNLEARVQWGKISEKLYGFNGRDDIAKLLTDFNCMAARLQALAESQRLLLRDVSHELRSPLARMGVALVLAKEETPALMSRHLVRIEYEAQRLNDLIGQLLALSYLDTIQETELPRTISLSDLVADLLPDVQYEAAQSQCVITTMIRPGCNILGDAALLRSAFENIVRNAIRHVPESGRIHVEAAPLEREGKIQSVVRISDNGPGIPQGELASVLEPFYRANDSRWKYSGFGIGLAIAKRAAGVHGGTIHIQNRPEGGLMVEMCFPRVVETA